MLDENIDLVVLISEMGDECNDTPRMGSKQARQHNRLVVCQIKNGKMHFMNEMEGHYIYCDFKVSNYTPHIYTILREEKINNDENLQSEISNFDES